MTDDQISKVSLLATLTLINSSTLIGLSTCTISLTDKILPTLPENIETQSLVNDLGELQTRLKLMFVTLEKVKQEFGVE
jgi:hypothetical protein